ncbi:MAG: signal transduction histidine kinase [Bacteroidetes bacterium]|jgi:ligand-binding sensor domain-containing protein|nr:signal transduction histidine kinase [Bacteroidota bacterium]
MYQDRQGYLWAGGFGGLTRFDGENFVNYNPKNGLIDHNVTAIAQDDYGNIFVGTAKGLSILVQNKIYNYTKAQGLSSPNISSFCKGYHHNMYIGTSKGLFTFSKNKISEVAALAGYKINHIYKSDTSDIYIGTDKGLIVYGHKKFEIIDESKGLPSNQVNSVVQKNGFIVIGTNKGLSFFNPSTKKITNYFIENGLIDENISTLLNQDNNFLWIGSQTGLLRFDGTQFNYYNIGYDNNSNVVRCILKDREENIWIGTHSGLFKYRDNSFSTYDKTNGPGNAFIFQIFRDRQENLWMCSDNNGIYKYYQGYFKRYGIKDGMNTNVCHAGIEDNEGRLLFGTKNGVIQFKNERFYDIPLPSEFKGSYEMLVQMKNKTTWIAGGNGIASLDWKNNQPEIKFKRLPGEEEYQIYGLCNDDNDHLYIGTQQGGLFKLIGDSIHHYSKELNLPELDYFAVKHYKDHLFSASLNGMMVINTKTGSYKYITEADGLNSEKVYSIEFAEGHRALWIGTNQGINKLNLKKFLETGKIEITAYGKLQGFMGVECNSNGIWEDKDGTLWFGTISGLVKHEPFNLKKNTQQNSTVLQNIKLLTEDTLLANGSELGSDFNTITFYYKGICLTNPDKVLYIKKLEGLEKEWSLPSTEDYSKYANLAPGKYTFKVKSCNDEGIWDEQETTFTFTILAPFYTKWWFIILVITCVSGLIYTTVMLRIGNIKKKQKVEFERRVEMSRIELKALRSQMNPHFIFNSLNSIQHYIFHSKSDEAIKYLSKFARLVRIILNNSNKPTVTVEEDLEALKLYLELEKMRFEDKFEYEIIIDPSVDADYDIMPPLLTQPYVENAILHGLNPKPEKGKLTITFTSRNNFLICTITDNGIGREKAAEIKRTMPVSKHKSLGMKITEDRLRILNEVNNSKLSVTVTDLKDEDGNALGTQVELYVPLNG